MEREWLEFGHKFADRCGHSPDKNINEISPVFYQWVDAVHQIMKQFPSAFQFNESFLVSNSTNLVEIIGICAHRLSMVILFYAMYVM